MLRSILSRPAASAALGRASSSGWAACVVGPRSAFSTTSSASSWLTAGGARRTYAKPASRFGRKRVEVLEREPEAASAPKSGSPSWLESAAQEQQQRQQQHSQFGSAPASSFPSYAASRRREEEQQQGSQWEALNDGVVAHMQKVYATLAAGIGIAAGASLFTMATPLVGMHPMIPGLAAMVPLMGIMYTSKHSTSPMLRAGMFAAFTGLSGVSLAPLCALALKMSPALVPQALVLTTGLFATMTGLSLMAKPGSMLRLGVPLGGGLLLLMATGIAGMFVPVTSAWYPLLHSVSTYGGLALFTLYIAYDTQKMIDEYHMGEDDHLKHAVDLFIDFKVIFTRILSILMLRGDD